MKFNSQTRRSGFTFIEIIIVTTIIGLLVAIAIPKGMQARDTARLSCIYNNLSQIEHAKEQWALDQKKTNGTVVTDMSVLSAYLKDGRVRDVMKETYVPNNVGTPAQADLPIGQPLGPYGPGAVIPTP
jgi:prepilin-type N-terminal cleavage/methylation domain-containing protein